VQNSGFTHLVFHLYIQEESKMGKFIDMTGWKMSEHGIPDSRITVIDKAPN
jgi:hypothetical protein